MEEELYFFSSESASHRLVLLHGWGADAQDLLYLGKQLIKSIHLEIELIAFNAPHLHPQGVGRQWYSLFPADWDEAKQGVSHLQNRIKNLDLSRIPLTKTVVLGFSQGGAMALAAGVSLPLAGLVGCSAYPHPDFILPSKVPSVFLTHGTYDPVVPVNASRKLLSIFKKKSLNTTINTFEGGHEIPSELYPKIQHFLEECFK